MTTIRVLGMDPSLRNWGMALANLDLTTGELSTPELSLVQPIDPQGKQVRQNSKDLHIAETLARDVTQIAKQATVVFVECPVGSQSARAMASYGICVGVLGSLRAQEIQLIEVTPLEVKQFFTGNKNATKQEMIDRAMELYPLANFPTHRGKVTGAAEHVSDAIATIHAGVRTPVFQNLMRLFSNTTKGNP